MRTTLSDASAVGSPPAAHRSKRERVLSPPYPARAPGDRLPGAPCAALAQPTQANAGAGGPALHQVERADAGPAGADEEGRRRAQAPGMPALVCTHVHSPGGGACHSTQPPCMHPVVPAVACQGPPGDGMSHGAATPQQHPYLYQHIREREYPHFIAFQAQQGISQQDAHVMWHDYESRPCRAYEQAFLSLWARMGVSPFGVTIEEAG